MSDLLKERNEIEEQYRWDLSTLYASDEAFEEDFAKLDGCIAKVAAFRGKLTDAASLKACFEADTELDLLLSDLFCYANLRRSEDTRAEDAQALYMRIYGKYVEAMTLTSFVRPEVLALPEETLQAIRDDEQMADYAYTMERLLRSKPHTLTADQEELLASFGEVVAAPSEIADNLMDADMVFESVTDKDGKEREVSTSSYIDLQMSDDRVLRENAFHSFYKSWQQHINTFAASYGGTVKGHVAEAAARHYESSRAMSMAHENVPTSVYDSLIEAVRDNLPTMYRYVDFRKKMQAAYCFGPLLKLLEDNAPCFEGRKVSRRLLRTDIWRRVDPARCGIVPGVFSEMFGFADYASFIGAMPPIFIKKDGEILPTGFRTVAELYEGTAPERDEIEHLLSMAFPDVRLKQFLEIRFADSVPYPFMLAYCALIKGLIYSGEGTEWAGELIRRRNLTEASVTEAEYSLMEHGWDGSVYGFPAADMSRELIALAERNIPDEEKSLLDPLRDVIRYGGISRIPGEESGSLQ